MGLAYKTFANAGVPAANRGLVVQVDAAEFQIALVRSRGGSPVGEHR